MSCCSKSRDETMARIADHKEIEGWLTEEEAVELYSLAMQAKSPKPVFCEIGTWKGKSACVLATAAKEVKGTLFCVDPFTGVGDAASERAYKKVISQSSLPLKKEFEENMERLNLLSYTRVIPKLSKDARKDFPADHLDLLFIDGNHDYDFVMQDFILWSPLVQHGGYLALHDVGAIHTDGPRRVSEEKIVSSSDWIDVKIVGETLVAQRK